MRFLFECVGCCTISSPEPSSPATPAAEETRSLVAHPAPLPPVSRRRKRATAAEWKPSLFAISEENAIVVAPARVDNRNGRSPVTVNVGDRSVKRCGPSSARVNASRSNTRDFSRDPGPIVIPSAFTAAPFMF